MAEFNVSELFLVPAAHKIQNCTRSALVRIIILIMICGFFFFFPKSMSLFNRIGWRDGTVHIFINIPPLSQRSVIFHRTTFTGPAGKRTLKNLPADWPTYLLTFRKEFCVTVLFPRLKADPY